MLVPVRVTDDNTYAHLSGRVFATYALRSAIWDCMHPIYTTAMACALCTYGFDSIPLIFFGSTFYTGIAIINTHPITERYRQREAIYEALGRDKTGGGMPFLLRWR